MADDVTSQTLHDGPRNLVMKFTNISDGTGESAVTKVDVDTLSPAASEVRIVGVHYDTDGMSVQILWDADSDVLALAIPEDESGTFCFRKFGGITNNAGTGVTGDIKFTTVGHTNGDTYNITLEMVKKA